MKDCTLYKMMDIIGKRWTLCILLELHKGDKYQKQFNELKAMLGDITPKMLSTRLKELEAHGLVEKELDSSAIPVKSFYSLSESGQEFIEIIKEIKGWGLKWKFDNPLCIVSDCKYCGVAKATDN
ncbi:transcriptional regulator [Methanohalophilus sp. RSK]|uniref:winged helix-turn-helix transcriptional regulator n=1 Tax=Methanohalophilus sp. RSK TaxID=2485783 RepID=UPI000F43DA22|nr:helix-turn-helix domain-containing protein [Methanohalophilus sp. RSK]RNI14556.1 transcriptional regulator [Methanohalophilus sp. RSK]